MGNLTSSCALVKAVSASYNAPIIIVIFILGFIGNVVALWIFSFHVKSWKPNTVYSLNLAIADTMLICCLPFRADYYIREKDWIYGDVPCRLKIFLISLNRAGSIMFLTTMAIDRYFKVVHPHHRVNTTSTRCAVKVAGSLWILAVAICSHLLVEPRSFEHDNRTYCEPFDMSNPLRPTAIWTDIVFILFKFAIPAPIILFSTSCIIWKLNQIKIELRSKYKRAMKLVIAVAAVFVICFLPTNIAVIAVLIAKLRGAEGCKSYETAVHVFYNTLFMTYLNSVLDPVIYYFSSSTFKNALMKAVTSLNLNCARSKTDSVRESSGEIDGGHQSKRTAVCHNCEPSQTVSTLFA
ncbi:hydroxycarboxylic acid receptor 2-like [Hemiscyllium ocellatum]|uniref:hydroxycarboxylic acid receptor 2-like n=1 Tax=Hemiscyllium ocellatum TaxID=170820 RepID=UPI0029675821|nr:hydroxycarboxylic acid receptor 2-like [Hemiscyllium ocellatum]